MWRIEAPSECPVCGIPHATCTPETAGEQIMAVIVDQGLASQVGTGKHSPKGPTTYYEGGREEPYIRPGTRTGEPPPVSEPALLVGDDAVAQESPVQASLKKKR